MDRLLEQVQSGDFDPIKEFAGNEDKFLEVKTAMESISNNLPKDVCIKFILTKIAPTVFDKTVENSIRDGALEIGLHFLKFVNVSVLSITEQERVFNSIEKTYTKVIDELRDSNYHCWDKLWIFLIKLCHEKLHSRMSTANKLLRVVEVAFRNSTSIEQRLKAYDCWVELIDNSSLNMDHMCSARQIKLLVTPMKAKFSRTPIVIRKRCDTFVYLLEKLQDKALLCLSEFLEFCFGPFDEKNDAEKMKHGRSVSEVCNKSTRVLLEILGHSHEGNLENCLVNVDFNLFKPLINSVNFSNFSEILINSVVQCCYLLNEWSQDSLINDTIVKCLWRSLLQFVHGSKDDVKLKCCAQITSSLRKLLEKAQSNRYLYTVLGNIVDLLIQNGFQEKLKEVIFDVSINVLHHIDKSSSLNLEKIENFLISCFDPENGSKFDKIASNSFKHNVKCENSNLCEVWLKCKIVLVPENVTIFIWPVPHIQHFRNIEALKSKWTKLYTSECKSESLKVVMMQEMEKLFLTNPLLSSNIIQFLEVMSGESNPTRDFVTKLMRLIELVLTLPNLTVSDVKKITSIVLTYSNQTLPFYKSENNDEALDKLCGCLEHLVTIHKDYTILPELSNCLRNSQPKNLAKFSKRLMAFLETLMLNEDNSIANNTRKLIELLETKENEPECVSSTSSRSLRLIIMANNTAKSKKPTNSKFASPLSLKTSTPVSSPRARNRIDNNKKKNPITTISPDNSADYVKMDTEVKINIENLSEHQKEMFKKRREDIPALYQDLTQQSHSQDFLNRIGQHNKNDESEENKKRKRSTDNDEVQISKISKIFDEPLLEIQNDVEKDILDIDTETQISDSLDTGLTEIFGDGVERVQREPPEELFEETPPKILVHARETMPKVPETVEVEENKENQENDQGPINEPNSIQIEEKNESNTTDKNEEQTTVEQVVEEKISPRTGRRNNSSRLRLSVSTPLRKSSRNTVRRIRQELIIQEQETKVDDESNQSKIEGEQDVGTIQENGEQDGENQVNSEEEKTPSLNETPLRKTKRQMKTRNSASMETLQKMKKKSEETKETVQTSQDDFETKPEERNDAVANLSIRNRRKQRKEQIQRLLESDGGEEENLTIEELLARVDKRIEENKRLERKQKSLESKENSDESTLQDDNQNKIISPVDTKADVDSHQQTKNRIIKKAKRLLPAPIDKVNDNVNGEQTMILNAVNKIKNIEKAMEVYEFKGEEKYPVQGEEAKKPKRRRRSAPFNRSGYISKRRKKIKKEVREEGFPFHVTADSPLPLSRSPSLRTVTPSSETITIVITRSPPETPGESQQIDDASPIPSSPKTRNRSRRSPNSEDVIESSQTPANTSRRRKSTSRNRRSLKPITIEEEGEAEEELILLNLSASKRQTRNSKQRNDDETATETTDIVKSQTPSEEMFRPLKVPRTRRLSLTEPESERSKFSRRQKRSKSLDKLDFTAEPIDFTKNQTNQRTEIIPRNDSSADTLTCDTLTSTVDQEPNPNSRQDVANADTLSLSPVKNGTKDDVPTSPITCDTPDRIREFLNNTSDISPINTTAEVATPVLKPTNEVSNVRVARLLQMVNSNVQVSSEGRRWFGNKHSSPCSSKVKKIRKRTEENLDILTFSREVPSPLTVPASGILKRKFALEETATPSPKRKRVNFSDPAITDKKIFIKDSEEYEDADETPDSTKESQQPLDLAQDFNENVGDKKAKELPCPFDREDALFHFRDFCDSNFKDMNDDEVKSALKCLLQNLKLPEILDVMCEFFGSIEANSEATDEDRVALTERGPPQRIVDEFIVPVVKNFFSFEDFLPTLLKLVEKLPDDDLQKFISEVTKDKTVNDKMRDDGPKTVPTEREIEDHIINLNSDKMNDLIKKYFSNLENEQRNDFLIDLMSLASNELPVNKQFVNCHVNILQNFVKKMND